MGDRFRPADHGELEKLVGWAVSEDQPLELVGAGSKRSLGRPVQASHTLDLSGLAGVHMYEPEELVLSAGPGTPMREIEALLAGQDQALAFEPPDFADLFGTSVGATLGGIVASNLSGPRRVKAGAVRDHVLGLRAVSGRGETFKTGGRVVKNVTGYDLCKLMTGSFGTLAALSDLTVKVLPAPELVRTVLVLGLDNGSAMRAMSVALGGRHEVSSAAHLPAAASARSSVSHVSGARRAVTALRVEGVRPSVLARCTALRDDLAPFGAVEELHSNNSRTLWREIRDVCLLPAYESLWRISVPPTDGASVGDQIWAATQAEILFDWGGGLIWAAVEAGASDAGAAAIRGALTSGHATLFRAPENVRKSVEVFQPLGLVGPLSARIKKAFDPNGIFNPGRMYAGV